MSVGKKETVYVPQGLSNNTRNRMCSLHAGLDLSAEHKCFGQFKEDHQAVLGFVLAIIYRVIKSSLLKQF